MTLLILATTATALLAPPPPKRTVVARLSPADAWTSYLAALETAPLLTKCVTATCIIGAGDAAAQAIEGDIDPARVARWGLFGLVLQAPWNHYYQNAIEAALPSTVDPWTARTALKVGIDQFVQAPIFTVLIFYFFAVIEKRGLLAATDQVRRELRATLLKNWIIFVPATVVNFAFIPLDFRVLFINCVFFVWVIILSLVINQTK